MSSHHIVREKQEPALLIANLNGFNYENLGQLLEWSPTVVVTESEYENVDSLGIKIDAVISSRLTPDLQESTLVIHSELDPVEDALDFLISEEYPSVNIIIDQINLKGFERFLGRIDLVFLTPQQRLFPIHPGFSKWKAANEPIEVLTPISNLETQGLKKISDKHYVTEKDGFYSLLFDQNFAFIAENI
jgi:thiamine pyrophosphokinase